MCAMQPVRRASKQVAMLDVELNAKSLEANQMHVNLTRTDLATTRHSHVSLAKAADQRTENGNACAHLGNKLIRSLVAVDGSRVDDESVAVALNSRTKTRKDFAHDGDVRNERNVMKNGLTTSKKSSRHEFERRILSAGNPYLTLQRTIAAYDDDLFRHTRPFHSVSLSMIIKKGPIEIDDRAFLPKFLYSSHVPSY